MFVIATSNEKFAARWMKVSGSKVTVRMIGSIAALFDFSVGQFCKTDRSGHEFAGCA